MWHINAFDEDAAASASAAVAVAPRHMMAVAWLWVALLGCMCFALLCANGCVAVCVCGWGFACWMGLCVVLMTIALADIGCLLHMVACCSLGGVLCRE